MTTAPELLPEEYFSWLYAQVWTGEEHDPEHSYRTVADRMYIQRFEPLVPHDENRIADGAHLRNAFLRDHGQEPLDNVTVLFPDASVFEVLVGLARRGGDMINMPAMRLFGIFLVNLRLHLYTDAYCQRHSYKGADRIIQRFNLRNYGPDGHGGLFPLRHYNQDQRGVELWYQMAAFMDENNMY